MRLYLQTTSACYSLILLWEVLYYPLIHVITLFQFRLHQYNQQNSSSERFFIACNLILIPTTISIFCLCYWSTTASVSPQSPAGWYFLFICQLTLWNGPLDDGEIGREAFLSNGAVSVDCKCQDASVGDNSARGVLPAVSPYVWTHWNGEEA